MQQKKPMACLHVTSQINDESLGRIPRVPYALFERSHFEKEVIAAQGYLNVNIFFLKCIFKVLR